MSMTYEEIEVARWRVKWAKAGDPYLDHLLRHGWEPFGVDRSWIYVRKYVDPTVDVEENQ